MMGTESAESGVHLPSSGRLLGVLVEIYGLREHSEYLAESTARRFFRGKNVSAEKRAHILEEISLSFQRSLGESPRFLSAKPLGLAAQTWDGVRQTVQSSSRALESFRGLGTAPLFIMREALVLRAREFLPSPHGQELPKAKHRYGFDKWLREQLEASPWRLSRDRLADLRGYNRKTVDAWLDRSAVPKPEKILGLAQFFGEQLGVDPSQLAIEIRQRCTVSRFAKWLQSKVPRARRKHAA